MKVLREDIVILFFAWRNPATPRYIKTSLLLVVLYLISPIDFIPDYFPVLGMVDDMTVVPAALLCVTRLLPAGVREECAAKTRKAAARTPYILTAAAACLALWMAFLLWGIYTLLT